MPRGSLSLAALAVSFCAVAAPVRVLAAPHVTLVSPGAGGCIPAAGGPTQAVAGADPPVFPSPSTVVADLSDDDGAPLTVVLTVAGQVAASTVYVPSAAGAVDRVVLDVPAQALHDGAAQVVHLEVTSAGGVADAEVTADVDRVPPRVTFDPADLTHQNTCQLGVPGDPQYAVADVGDPAPAAAGVWSADGCRLLFKVTASDHCGDTPNEAIVTYALRQAPATPPVVVFAGVGENETSLAATVNYAVDTPEGCVERVDATLQAAGGPVGFLVNGAVIRDPGQYTATVQVDPVCTDRLASGSRHFTVVSGPTADAGGPYAVAQGESIVLDASASRSPAEAGAITTYDWDLDNDGFYDRLDAGPSVAFSRRDQGTFQIWVRIRTALGVTAFDDATVTVGDAQPVCDVGGPYTVEQGQPVTLDASASHGGAASEPILAYGWDFGDGRFPQLGDGLTHPVHRYAAEGAYTVTLTAQDIDSACTATATVTVLDVVPVIRNLHIVEAAPVEGDTIHASAGQTSAGSAAEPLVGFSWDWGDGSPPEGGPEVRGPTHTYADDGDFQVCLTVTDGDSAAHDCVPLTVADLSPFARLAGPAYALEGDPVAFDAVGTRAGGLADPLTSLTWDWGDGTPLQNVGIDALRLTHAFTRAGHLTVTMTAHDEDSTAAATVDILVEDAQPTAILEAPLQGLEGQPLVFDASASFGGAPSDPIVEYLWDFGDGEAADGPDLSVAQHSFANDGIYIVAVTTVDADGSRARQDALVRIANVAPADAHIVQVGPGQPVLGQPVHLRVEFVDVPGDNVRARWTFGDGTSLDGPVEVDHAFDRPGRFHVRVSLDDGDGGTAEADVMLEIARPGPTIVGPVGAQAREGAPFSVQIDVRPAPDGAGGLDGPVTVRVPVLPAGATVHAVDLVGAVPGRRLTIDWVPGFAQEGLHAIHVDARSHSGLRSTYDLTVDVADVAQPMLVALGGTNEAGEVALFDWRRLPATRTVAFELVGRTPLGERAVDAVSAVDGRWIYLALARSGTIGVVDGRTGELVRRIPLAPDGHPPVLFMADGVVWALGGGGAVAPIADETLKLARHGAVALDFRPDTGVWIPDASAPQLLLAAQGGHRVSLVDGTALRADRAVASVRLDVAFTVGAMAWDAANDRLLIADGRGPSLHRLSGVGLRAIPPRVVDAELPLPAVALELSVGGTQAWALTGGGLVTLDGDTAVPFNNRVYDAVAMVPDDVNDGASVALATRSAVEQVRLSDGTTVGLWRDFGARRLLGVLRSAPHPMP